MTQKLIPFISQLALSEQLRWLERLNELFEQRTAHQPTVCNSTSDNDTYPIANIKVVLASTLSDSEKSQCEIAIVANPEPDVLADFPKLVWIQSLWAGVERLVAEIPSPSFEIVRLVDPCLAKTMAEAVVAWTLYLHRNMPEYAQQQKNKTWQQLPYTPAKNLRVSVLGAGNLGTAALKALQTFNYQLNCWSRTPKHLNGVKNYTGDSGLKSMVRNSDILISLLPLTSETNHLLGSNLLKLLPSGAKVINFSRGAVIDTKALVELLDNRHIAHAVLDVFEQEPLAPTNPKWCNPNITVLPHISAPTEMSSAINIASENIKNYRDFKVIPNFVNTNLGY